MDINWVDLTTIFSNVATAITLPVTAAIFLHDTRKDRLAKQHENDGDLKEMYFHITTMLIENPELDQHDTPIENPQDMRRQLRIYEMLVSLFETAYLRLARESENEMQDLWASWEDYINEWLTEPNFRDALPRLLKGENPEFAEFIHKKLAENEAGKTPPPIMLLGMTAPGPGGSSAHH